MRNLIPLIAIVLSACAPKSTCEHLTDCPGSLVCSPTGTCIESDAPVVVVGSGFTGPSARSQPSDSLEDLADVTAGFAGSIGGTPFETSTPIVEGGADGYVAYQLTTTAFDGSDVGMWFDIPLPSLLTEGVPRTFTLEEMLADGSFPCISLWNGDGVSAWAEDYVMTVHPPDELGNVQLEIDASNTDSEAVATITVPRLL